MTFIYAISVFYSTKIVYIASSDMIGSTDKLQKKTHFESVQPVSCPNFLHLVVLKDDIRRPSSHFCNIWSCIVYLPIFSLLEVKPVIFASLEE